MSTPNERRMAPDRGQRIEAIYREMLGRPEDQRRAALIDACAGDPTLQAEVERLLTEAPSAAGFVDTPPLQVAAGPVPQASSFWNGRRIGVFEIQGLLGAGDMGEVYRARDTRLGREVAIKILPDFSGSSEMYWPVGRTLKSRSPASRRGSAIR